MLINGTPYRSIWLDEETSNVHVIDQRALPWRFEIQSMRSNDDAYEAISDMTVSGAPLIGVTGPWGPYLTARAEPENYGHFRRTANKLMKARPTAINLRWALEKVTSGIDPNQDLRAQTRQLAESICDDDVATYAAIGDHSVALINRLTDGASPFNVLTHCNAGWLATVDRGTATAPIYSAHEQGILVDVWVDETRPRNRGGFTDSLGTSPSEHRSHDHRRQCGRTAHATW